MFIVYIATATATAATDSNVIALTELKPCTLLFCGAGLTLMNHAARIKALAYASDGNGGDACGGAGGDVGAGKTLENLSRRLLNEILPRPGADAEWINRTKPPFLDSVLFAEALATPDWHELQSAAVSSSSNRSTASDLPEGSVVIACVGQLLEYIGHVAAAHRLATPPSKCPNAKTKTIMNTNTDTETDTKGACVTTAESTVDKSLSLLARILVADLPFQYFAVPARQLELFATEPTETSTHG